MLFSSCRIEKIATDINTAVEIRNRITEDFPSSICENSGSF